MEVQLSGRHPADYRWLGGFLAGEILSLDACGIYSSAGSEEFRQRNIECDVALVNLAAQRGARTPQTQHRFSIPASPQENDVACKITMREPQPDDLNVESLRRVCISDRQMRFVQVHVIRLHALPV
jgi:hypothetical protein